MDARSRIDSVIIATFNQKKAVDDTLNAIADADVSTDAFTTTVLRHYPFGLEPDDLDGVEDRAYLQNAAISKRNEIKAVNAIFSKDATNISQLDALLRAATPDAIRAALHAHPEQFNDVNPTQGQNGSNDLSDDAAKHLKEAAQSKKNEFLALIAINSKGTKQIEHLQPIVSAADPNAIRTAIKIHPEHFGNIQPQGNQDLSDEGALNLKEAAFKRLNYLQAFKAVNTKKFAQRDELTALLPPATPDNIRTALQANPAYFGGINLPAGRENFPDTWTEVLQDAAVRRMNFLLALNTINNKPAANIDELKPLLPPNNTDAARAAMRAHPDHFGIAAYPQRNTQQMIESTILKLQKLALSRTNEVAILVAINNKPEADLSQVEPLAILNNANDVRNAIKAHPEHFGNVKLTANAAEELSDNAALTIKNAVIAKLHDHRFTSIRDAIKNHANRDELGALIQAIQSNATLDTTRLALQPIYRDTQKLLQDADLPELLGEATKQHNFLTIQQAINDKIALDASLTALAQAVPQQPTETRAILNSHRQQLGSIDLTNNENNETVLTNEAAEKLRLAAVTKQQTLKTQMQPLMDALGKADDEARENALPAALNSLLRGPTALAANHPLLPSLQALNTAVNNLNTKKALPETTDNEKNQKISEISEARQKIKEEIKSVKEKLSEAQKDSRNIAYADVTQSNLSDKEKQGDWIKNVRERLDTYVFNINRLKVRAEVAAHSRSRDSELPEIVKELKHLQLQLKLYHDYITKQNTAAVAPTEKAGIFKKTQQLMTPSKKEQEASYIQKVSDSIKLTDTILNKAERGLQKELKLATFADKAEVLDNPNQLSPDPLNPGQQVNAKTLLIREYLGNNANSLLQGQLVQGGKMPLLRDFNASQVLVSRDRLEVGTFTKEKVSFVSAEFTDKNKAVSELYFNPKDFAKLDKQGKLKCVARYVERFRLKLTNPTKTMMIQGDLPKEFIKLTQSYCDSKGYNCGNEIGFKSSPSDITNIKNTLHSNAAFFFGKESRELVYSKDEAEIMQKLTTPTKRN